MAYKSKVLARADGGTGLASPGTSGNILTSDGTNWTSAAPAASGLGYAMQILTNTGASPADSQTYFMGNTGNFTTVTTSGLNLRPLYITHAGTITAVYGAIKVAGTLGSNENITIAIRLNNSSDTTVTGTAQATAALNAFGNGALSISVAAGDYIEMKVTTPAWNTNPTNISLSATIYVS